MAPTLDFGAGIDLPDRQAAGRSQSQDVSDFSHCGFSWLDMDSSQKIGQGIKQLEKQCIRKDSGPT